MIKRLAAVFSVFLLTLIITSNTVHAEENSFYDNANTARAAGQKALPNCYEPFSMVWFTDTQYYAESHPQIYDFLGDWLVQEYKKGAFGYVINTGDIVNSAADTKQWEVASRNFKKLEDAAVPYGILAGNHDVSINGIVDYRMFSKYFGASRYKDKFWYGESTTDNRNHYDIISLGCHDFIILYLGYTENLTEKTIMWSNKVLKKYSNRTAILAMHEYLNCNSGLTEMAGIVFNRIVVKNDNVIMVLCGHNYGTVRNIKTVANSDGSTRKVLEMLADYQYAPHGGDGYLRYLTFYPEYGELRVKTYSPYKNKYNYFEGKKDSFIEKIKLIDSI